MNNLAIIPARSGSKGLKDKNIKELHGKPLLSYSVEAALDSKMYSHVMVSTDSKVYAQIAKDSSAEVPFLRNADSATDVASSWDVVREVLENYEKIGQQFDTVTLLQPTSPLRNAVDICNAFNLYKEKDATAVVSVCEMEHSPLWSNTLPDTLCMDGFLSNATNRQRQQLDTFYRINGAIYIVNVKHFMNGYEIYGKGCYAYVMPINRSVDVDTEEDMKLVEYYISGGGGTLIDPYI